MYVAIIENSSSKSTKSTSCFIFVFDISKLTELMKKFLKKTTVGISWEIWCSNSEEYQKCSPAPLFFAEVRDYFLSKTCQATS